MAAVTVTGSVGGTPISFPTTTAIQAALAQVIVRAAAAGGTLVTTPGVTTLATGVTISTATGAIISGTPTVASAQIALDGSSNAYVNNGTILSTVVAADNANAVIINDTPLSGLVAVTGAGSNTLEGNFGANQFVTGVNGSDAVILNGAANSLTSYGSDAVLVGGPSTVTAMASGSDNIVLTSNTTLVFGNLSQAGTVDSVTGAAGSTIALAGTGATSVTAGSGNESFVVDTSAGNTTLVGNASGVIDTFTFLKDAANASANVTVNNLTTTDAINLVGYGYAGAVPTLTQAGSSVQVTLSDKSTLTFNNTTVAAVTSILKTTG